MNSLLQPDTVLIVLVLVRDIAESSKLLSRHILKCQVLPQRRFNRSDLYLTKSECCITLLELLLGKETPATLLRGLCKFLLKLGDLLI